MKIHTNEPRIKQKQKTGILFSVVGMIVLAVALFVVFSQPENTALSWALLLLGFPIALVGTYFINRWVRPPLPENVLEKSLQRLDARYVLFNHFPPIPHLLLTPRGLVAIRAKRYEGPVDYHPETGRWKGKLSLARLYGHGLTAEGLGDPAEEVTRARNEVLAWLQARLPELAEEVPIEGVALFVSPKSELKAEGSPVPLAQADSIKKTIQQLLTTHSELPKNTYKQLRDLLEAEVGNGADETA